MKAKVFYTPAIRNEINQVVQPTSVIDEVMPDGLSWVMRQSLDEMRLRYPTVQIGEYDAVRNMIEADRTTSPVECSEEDFNEALSCLPPVAWIHEGNTESFKMCERITGSITTIYVRVGETYWRLDDKYTTPHKELLSKVEIAIKSTLAETA